MATKDGDTGKTTTWRARRHHARLECRECSAICERVVHPWQCLRSHCEGVYAYEDGETMYFGCLYKVFRAEFDLSSFCDSPRQGARSDRRVIRSTDPFGAVRVTGSPRPQCAVRVEQAYDAPGASQGCCNPTFFHQPFAGGDAMKLTAMPSGEESGESES
jgi:hypothetical protein